MGIIRSQLSDRPVDLLGLHGIFPGRYPYILQSTIEPANSRPLLGRYDIVPVPNGEMLWLDVAGLHSTGCTADGHDFLTALDDWFQPGRAQNPAEEGNAFAGGWFLYLSYELAQQVEPVLNLKHSPGELPLAFAARCPVCLIHDHSTGEVLMQAEPGAEELAARVRYDFTQIMRAPTGGARIMPAAITATVREQPEETYTRSVERIKAYIHAGDVFQVNLSRQWELQLRKDVPHEWLFRRLRSGNPAPFSGLMRWGNTTVISSSPERLVKISGRQVETRPIAGTYPRSHPGADPRQETEALLRHPKERAEHIMLIDLERNDLGRVCEPGSVQVDEMMSLESYRHVHHIVSNVTGRLKAGTGPGAVIRAVFPGGTITGCPKVRCMEIISELEAEARGAYTGSFGYLDSCGRLDLNILIRSMTCHGRNIVFRAGAGIVADSIAAKELEETRAKARGLLRVFSDTP